MTAFFDIMTANYDTMITYYDTMTAYCDIKLRILLLCGYFRGILSFKVIKCTIFPK